MKQRETLGLGGLDRPLDQRLRLTWLGVILSDGLEETSMASRAERPERLALTRMRRSLGARSLQRRCRVCLKKSRTFVRCDHGVAAIEFALLAPLFLLILVAVIDIGMVLRTRFLLNTELSSAANYSLVYGGALVDAEGAVGFAEQVARQLGAGRAVEAATVLVNQAASATLAGSGVTTTDQGRDAALCYCPTRMDGTITWGGDIACLSTCPDSSNSAGRYIEITANTSHNSFFGNIVFGSDEVSVHTIVRID